MYINRDILIKYIDEQELIRLTDDQNLGAVNQQVLDEAINNAENEIDGYLIQLYDKSAFPAELPGMLIQLVVDLTIYNLYKRRFRLEMPESLVKLHEDTLQKLQRIAKGEIVLSLPKKSEAGFIKINKTSQDRLYDIDKLEML